MSQLAHEEPLEDEIQRYRQRLDACPTTHPERGNACHDLGTSLFRSWMLKPSAALLDEVITLHREALALRPDGHPDHAASCNSLGIALRGCYEATGATPSLDESIKLHYEAIALHPGGHPDRAASCNNLATALWLRHQVTGGSDLLDEIITLHREALALRPAGHPDRSQSLNNLALALHNRYKVTGSSDLLDEIIKLLREALALRPGGHPDRSLSCNSLGIAILRRYLVMGSSDLIEEAIKLLREAVAGRLPAGHPARARSCDNLGFALQTRYNITGGSGLLDEAIKLHREALALRPAGHPERALSCNNLALALQDRYRATGGSDLLNEVIEIKREALALQPAGHPDHAVACNNLASALVDRYLVTGNSDTLDEMITLYSEALALRPGGHPKHWSTCSNLAEALLRRYEVTGSSDLLNKIITLGREAFASQPAGHPLRSELCSNLAALLQYRYEVTGSSNLLDEIITLGREAHALRPAGHPSRSESCRYLASALQHRYQVTGSSTLLDEVITLQRECVTILPAEHPDCAALCNDLALSLWQRFRKTMDVKVVDEVLDLARDNAASAPSSEVWRSLLILFRIHAEQGSPHFSIQTATEYLLQASASLPSTIAKFMREMQSRLDRMWLMHDTWTPDTTLALMEVYSNIIDGLSRMTGFAVDTISQLTALRSARSFGSDACVAALLSGRPRQAIELMDHAHGVIWTQALHQRDPQLRDVPQSLASELEALFRAVSMPMSPHKRAPAHTTTGYLSPEDVRDQQNSRIQTLLTEIRAMPGLERFMLGRTYAQLRETAREHPVVVLVSARGHVYALIICDSVKEDPDKLHLELTSDRLALLRDTAACVGLRNADAPQDVNTQLGRAMHISKRKETTALSTLADLWHDVVKPVIDHLQLQPATDRAKPRLHWCPTGDFALLPIHAAGIYDGPDSTRVCCSDYVVSSYTPTLSALLNAQNKAHTAPSHLDMLAVGEDARALPTMPRLFFVERELTTVEDTAKASKRDCSVDTIPHHATVEGVTARIQTAHFVHLACHGTQDQTSALNSGFHLSDKKLTISELMDLNLDKAWFAYLSACETAKSDAQQPDQVVHIASAMLHAGFKSVVATMWSMGDADGPDLAQWFYEDLFSNEVIDADAVAYALDVAVEKLKVKIPRGAARWALRWAPYIHMGA